MATFTYEAINKSGETVTGSMEGEQENSVIERLRTMGLLITGIKEARKPLFSGFSLARKVKPGELSMFSRQLAAMLNAGIPLTRALFTLSKQVPNATMKTALYQIARGVEGGTSFSEALKSYPAIYSKLYVGMISSGEIGGNLETSLSRLAQQLQKDKELRDNIKSATFYPLAVLIFAFVILFGMLFFLVPIFMGFFPPGAVMPLPTRVIMAASTVLRAYWYLVLPAMAAVFFSIRHYFKSPAGKRNFDRVSFRLPVFGSLIQKTVVARFARTFSTLMASGIPVVSALEAAGTASGHSIVIDVVTGAGVKIHEGKNISAPLEQSGIFPPMVTHMIAVGEETGDLPEMMDRVADFYEEEVATITKGLISLIEPLMLIVIGVIVGGMLIALYLPIFTAITQIN